jgi:hypothetical protein
MKISNVKMIDVYDWDRLVSDTYGRVYSFQQQEGCKDRGVFHLTVPTEEINEEYMNDSIPEEVNGEEMGVKFNVWLSKDPKIHNFESKWENDLFWERNFYPDINIVANDLYKKGLIEKGNYIINIDW